MQIHENWFLLIPINQEISTHNIWNQYARKEGIKYTELKDKLFGYADLKHIIYTKKKSGYVWLKQKNIIEYSENIYVEYSSRKDIYTIRFKNISNNNLGILSKLLNKYKCEMQYISCDGYIYIKTTDLYNLLKTTIIDMLTKKQTKTL